MMKNKKPLSARKKFNQLFGVEKPIIGMVHVQALPGTPRHHYPMDKIIEVAVQEAVVLVKYGVHAVMLENMHDVPYLNRIVGPEIIAAMTAVASAVRKAVKVPLGIQILAGANQAALAVALAADFQFIRAEGFVFGHVADEGYMDSDAGELLRYRKMIGAEHIAVFTDIKKKHSAHAITTDVTLAETAQAAEFFLSDGLIITGTATGSPTDPEDLKAVRKATDLPVLVGSGVTPENFQSVAHYADGFIIGSYFKKDGYWKNGVDGGRVKLLYRAWMEMGGR
ncbi:MAG: BtpA/SgcQ family protein [Lentisphaeria bacterium]|nr:BtpA/SgcQ family protein [Candidatus Neomarinimicrobiota bacterium]MCF7843201.1 BtpA/SgcQ family protein [Lentisphaeria bacterium]